MYDYAMEYAHGRATIHLQSNMREVRSGVLAADIDVEWQDDQGMLLLRWYLPLSVPPFIETKNNKFSCPWWLR